MIEEALRLLLTGDSGVAAIVGARVFPGRADESAARPYIVYSRVTASRVRSTDGASGLAQPQFQVDCYAEKYLTAITLAARVRTLLENYRGTVTLSGSPTASLRIGGIALLFDQDLPENDSHPRLHRRLLNFQITHDEP